VLFSVFKDLPRRTHSYPQVSLCDFTICSLSCQAKKRLLLSERAAIYGREKNRKTPYLAPRLARGSRRSTHSYVKLRFSYAMDSSSKAPVASSHSTEGPNTDSQFQIASAFSTGGGGTIFEIKVQASLLAALLVRGHVPIFQDALIQELHLQAEHLGLKTDDALIVASDANGRKVRQLWSVKHEVKFTRSDTAFQDVISDAWADFTNRGKFDRDSDVFVLATGYLTRTNKDLLELLEVSYAAVSAEDFSRRVERKGFVSDNSRNYRDVIQELCKKAAGRDVLSDELWEFIRCLHIRSYDFDHRASQDEARFKTLLDLGLRGGSGKTGSDLWNAILKWVADRNPRAGSFTRESLPNDWQQITVGIAARFESGVIKRLAEHSDDLLKRIQTTLGPKLHLSRQDIGETIARHVLSEQFTLVTGQAGVGKSAAAYDALLRVLGGAPLFVFQAREFAHENLDQALASLRVNEPLSQISASFALHPRKFILIESVERLLEAPDREAFSMFLQRLADDASWRVVLTCRQQSAPMIRDVFLNPMQLGAQEIVVPLLSDDELEFVAQEVPGIQSLLANPRTCHLLRNPWFLDKACSVDWTSESASQPLDQRRLRDILWRQVVARDDVRTAGIHISRDNCFRDIALRRAQSLDSFVPVLSGEAAAAQALIADELLIEEQGTRRVAPAHDVLEDWALMRRVADLYITIGHEPQKFYQSLGRQLPVRRSYRMWLQENLAAEGLSDIRELVEATLADPNIEAYWKDETTVSVLLSAESPQFIAEHEKSILGKDRSQLHRFIHLLRIACKKPNPLLPLPQNNLASVLGDSSLIPEGEAWPALIRLLHENITKLDSEDMPLMLGLLEDWKAGIHWQIPLPTAAREVGLIALHLWNSAEKLHYSDDTLDRIANLILAVPSAISGEFAAVLEQEIERSERSPRSELLDKKLLASFEGWAACRSHSSQIARLARAQWGLDNPMPKRSRRDYDLDMEEHFGLRNKHDFRYFPASALQGPFWPMLQASPMEGIDLILKLSNVASERFVRLGLDAQYGDPPIEVTLDLGKGISHKQWCSPRLWLMYRGSMPGPDVLESALMCLEKWLLDLAKGGENLQTLTRYLILKSNSVAVTAAVASVAMAYPERVGDSALIFLRVPNFFELDLRRYVSDQSPTGSFLSNLANGVMQRIHYDQLKSSDDLPHRKTSLETFACELQCGTLREEVWKIIDAFQSELPPLEKQDDRHKLWRLKLHRIDLRQFRPERQLDDGRVLFTSKPVAPEIEEVVEKHRPALEANRHATSMSMWGLYVFKQEKPDVFDPTKWREFLLHAQRAIREPKPTEQSEFLLHEGGPAYVAAVCVKDHWSELDKDQRKWCRELLIAKILEADSASELEQHQRFEMAASRAAARVLPLLLDGSDGESAQAVRQAVAIALTNAVDEVREYSAIAVGQYLWDRDPDCASACMATVLDFAQLERRNLRNWRRLAYSGDGPHESFRSYISKRADMLRSRVAERRPLEDRKYYRFSVTDGFSVSALPKIGCIIFLQQSRPIAQKIHEQIAQSLAHSWKQRHKRNDGRNYQAEEIVMTQFANFIIRCEPEVALRLWRPFSRAVDAKADKVADIFDKLVVSENTARNDPTFWALWDETLESLLRCSDKMERMLEQRGDLARLSSSLLLDGAWVRWKDEAKDWEPLHGRETKIRDFVNEFGAAPPICKSFIRLLDSIGSFLLPNALQWLDNCLRNTDRAAIIADRDMSFRLSRILSPIVFSQSGRLRKTPALRSATLRILDAMVEQGSSTAFRMREFLISPPAPLANNVS
jgi:hypothetical protein